MIYIVMLFTYETTLSELHLLHSVEWDDDR